MNPSAVATARSRADRVIAKATLMDTPAPAAVAVIAGLIGVSWLTAYYLGGGTTHAAPHWFYIAIFLAGLRFGPFGALLAGCVSMWVAGPLLPANVASGAPQALSDWVSRGIFFVLIGQFVTLLFGGVRRLTAREAGLETAVSRAALDLQAREARFTALVQNSSDLVTIVDRDATVLFQSPSIARVLGWDAQSSLGTTLMAAVHVADHERWRSVVDLVVASTGAETTVEWRFRHADGSWRVLQSLVTDLTHEPSVGGLVLNSRDITDRKILEEQLRHEAFHDSLTGLANRALFAEHLAQAVRRRGRIGAGLAVLFIDLDSFKAVNDLHGHALGDDVLKQAAQRLQVTLRDADAIARLSGDEFAVLFEGVGLDSRPTSAATRLIEAFAEPFRAGSADVFVTASVGLAFDDGRTESAEDLLRNADLAMYAAKTKNKGSYEVFSPAMHSAIRDRLQLASELRRALDHDEFQVYYQPIVGAAGAIEEVEALIRWNHPSRGLVMPGGFIPAAESSALILEIGDWVLRHACGEFETSTRGLPGAATLGLSINLSTRQLSDPRLLDTVHDALANAGLEAERLTLEITESTIMDDLADATRVLTQLRRLGVKIAMDDFGTGYCSLSLLSEIPLDRLKIDRSFVAGMADRPESSRMIRAILGLASDLGLDTVVEGVEELEQYQRLQELGCQACQGYYFARPQPADQLVELLNAMPSFPRSDKSDPRARTAPGPRQHPRSPRPGRQITAAASLKLD